MNSNKINILRTISVTVFALALAGCMRGKDGADKDGDKKDKPAEVAIPVEVAVAKRVPMLSSYSGTASLEAEREADVVSKISGVLLRIRAEEGDAVHEGQVLAQIDPERARLEVARSEANLRRLENEFKRSQELYAAKLVSSEAHDKIRFELETQRAALAELAAHPPRTQEDLGRVRGLSATWKGNDIGERLMAGLAGAEPLSKDDLPANSPRAPGLGKDGSLVADLLKLLLKIRAREMNVASRLIARSDELEQLAAGARDGLSILKGWRAEVFGQDALELVEGRLGFAVVRGRLTMSRTAVESE